MSREHILNNHDNLGVFFSAYKYRKNGYYVISGGKGDGKDPVPGESGISSSDKRDVYGDIGRIKKVLAQRGTKPKPNNVKQAGDAHANRYTFAHDQSFTRGRSPYRNQAHHIIPWSTPFEKFTDEQKEILDKVDYDVNNGNNIIFLPEDVDDSTFHNLPHHNGCHPKYTSKVTKEVHQIKKNLNKANYELACGDDWSPPKDVPKALYDTQDMYWNLIKNMGAVSVNELIKPKKKRKKK